MMPAYLGWFFIVLFCYGACLLTWAGLTQSSRGKYKSSRRYFILAGLLGLSAIGFLMRRLTI
jgi:hypothetical protein